MRLLLDSSVLISATIAKGRCTELLEYCVGRHELVTCRFILQEIFEKLSVKLHYPISVAEATVKLFGERMSLVEPVSISPSPCRDPKDTAILGAGVAGRCRCIVTGDK